MSKAADHLVLGLSGKRSRAAKEVGGAAASRGTGGNAVSLGLGRRPWRWIAVRRRTAGCYGRGGAEGRVSQRPKDIDAVRPGAAGATDIEAGPIRASGWRSTRKRVGASPSAPGSRSGQFGQRQGIQTVIRLSRTVDGVEAGCGRDSLTS